MVHNCYREVFMHGRELYEEFRALVPELIQCPDGSVFVSPKIPTYDEIDEEWRRSAMKTWDSGGQWEDRPMEDVLVESMEPTSQVEGGDKDTV